MKEGRNKLSEEATQNQEDEPTEDQPEKSYIKKGANKLLIHEPPLQVLPSLAVLIGLNEALLLQQVQYWICNPLNKNIINGRKWVYNTFEDWHKQFPFWCLRTIKTIFASLENQKLLITGSFNKLAGNRTKWYTIDYDAIYSLVEGTKCKPCTMGDHTATFPPTIVQDLHDGKCKPCTMHSARFALSTINIDYLPEITTYNKKNKKTKKDFSREFEEFWLINPKQVDKIESRDVFDRLLTEDYGNFEKIMQGRRAQNVVIEWEGTPKKYIKSPAAWLRKRRFNDEVQTEEQLNEERQRIIKQISNKPRRLSEADKYHDLNVRVREAAEQELQRLDRELERLEQEEQRSGEQRENPHSFSSDKDI